jgi:hypothetical protein
MNPLAIEIWLYVLAAYTLGNLYKKTKRLKGKEKKSLSKLTFVSMLLLLLCAFDCIYPSIAGNG